MELHFVDNPFNVGDSTVQVVKVSVHHRPFGVASAILVTEQAPIINTMVPAPQCATLFICVPLLLQGPTVSWPLLGQSTSVAMPMLVPGTVLPPGTRAPTTMQGPAFPPVASAPMLCCKALLCCQWHMSHGSIRPRPILVQTWPHQLGQCICLVTCLGPWHSSLPCKPNEKSLLCNVKSWRLGS